ncbi:MAG TPA: hypothetical protein VK035_07145 [Kiloniellales bacterium]|nr:hypothetical protein [Kiloniellales bacterium]
MRPSLLALLVCLLAVSACGPLPRPFQPESKVAVDLRAPSTRAPFRVAAPQGEPSGDPKRFSLKVAEQLLTLGVPAEPQWFSMTTAPALETRRLQSRAAVTEAANGNERLEVEWLLLSPEGEERHLTVAQLLLPGGAWSNGSADLLDDAAFVSAAAISRALDMALPALERKDGDQATPRLVVLPIEGASGDGPESLEYAIVRALRDQGIALAAVPEQEDLLLGCFIDIGPAQGGVQPVTIQWQLLQAADFSEIGTVTQDNLVPAYSLAGAWRDSAAQIALAAAEGIAELLQQAGLRP